MAPNLGNCPQCGKLYLRVRNLCNDCIKKQEEDFLKTARYLREFPGSSIQEVSDATEVSTSQIRQFIRSGRIIVGNFPNLSYPCEICGKSIRSGKVCAQCSQSAIELKSNVNKVAEDPKSVKTKNGKANGYIKYL